MGPLHETIRWDKNTLLDDKRQEKQTFQKIISRGE